MLLYGTYQSDIARMLVVRLDRCTGQDYCLDEQKAKEHLKQNYVIVAENVIRFDDHNLGP